jgi:branched-chain amino acid transport system substrate-binding protein
MPFGPNDVETPLGKIRFDERGDAIGVGFSMYQVKTAPTSN